MRFLVDESCDFAIVRALRADGHDIVAVSEIEPRAADEAVLARAEREGRTLLTEDLDFGHLVFASGLPSPGVILMRFPSDARSALAAAVADFVRQHATELADGFAVVEPGRVRIRHRR
jgi:predicted nuclease of predicted toxin-antitoxin system